MKEPRFYSTIEWQKARSKAARAWRATGAPCHRCGQPLDWTTKGSVVIDHVLPRRQRPDLAYEQTNLAAVCHRCNTVKAIWSENNKREEIGMDGLPASWRL